MQEYPGRREVAARPPAADGMKPLPRDDVAGQPEFSIAAQVAVDAQLVEPPRQFGKGNVIELANNFDHRLLETLGVAVKIVAGEDGRGQADGVQVAVKSAKESDRS